MNKSIPDERSQKWCLEKPGGWCLEKPGGEHPPEPFEQINKEYSTEKKKSNMNLNRDRKKKDGWCHWTRSGLAGTNVAGTEVVSAGAGTKVATVVGGSLTNNLHDLVGKHISSYINITTIKYYSQYIFSTQRYRFCTIRQHQWISQRVFTSRVFTGMVIKSYTGKIWMCNCFWFVSG